MATPASAVPRRDENEVFAEYQAATDKEALERELIGLLRHHAFAVCFSTLREHRPDIVNLAAFQALRHIPNFKGNSKFSTWFHKIVLRLCLSELRRKKARREVQVQTDQLEDLCPHRDAKPEIKIELEQVAEKMQPADRELVIQKHFGEEDEDIANKLGISEASVRKRWQRLKKRARKKGRSKGGGNDPERARATDNQSKTTT